MANLSFVEVRCDTAKAGCGALLFERLLADGLTSAGMTRIVCHRCRRRVWIRDRDLTVIRIDRGRAPVAVRAAVA